MTLFTGLPAGRAARRKVSKYGPLFWSQLLRFQPFSSKER